jgi:hypothetical protein
MFTPKDIDTILLAAARGDVATVHAFLEGGMPLVAANHPGDTALGRAVASGHPEVVRILLGRGGDVNARDANGYTPLINAAIFGHAEVARVLLQGGADPHFRAHSHLFRGNRTTTALEQARGNGQQEVVELLLQAGVEPSPAEFAFDALRRFAQSAAQPAYQEVLRLMSELCGHPPRPWTKRKGVFSFSLEHLEPLAERYTVTEEPPAGSPQGEIARCQRLLDLLQAEVNEAGFSLVLPDALGPATGAKFRLMHELEGTRSFGFWWD